MPDERKIIGHLFGKPIYESDDPNFGKDVKVEFKSWDQFNRENLAENLGKQFADDAPKNGI